MKAKTLNYVLAIVVLILITAKYCPYFAGENAATKSTLEIIHQRKSVRNYTDQQVSKEQLQTLVKAGMAAPTAVNKQPWAFIAINDREILDQLGDVLPYAKMLKQATAAIVVCGDLDKTLPGEGQQFWIQDCSAATENVLLAAESIDLGAVWTAAYPNSERIRSVKDILNLPSKIIPLNVIAIGYPSGKDKPKDKWKPENLHWQKW